METIINETNEQLTAKHAKVTRQLANDSNFLHKLAFKLIKEAASRNEISVCLDITNKSQVAIDALIKELKEYDFLVKYRTNRYADGTSSMDTSVLIISW